MITTLNGLLDQIKVFANAHTQIGSYFFEPIREINLSGTVNYPAMLVYMQPSQRLWFETQINLDVYFVDRLLTDKSNEQELFSDMIQIAEDFIAYMRHPSLQALGVSLRDSDQQNIEPISEATPDNLTGVLISISIPLSKPDDRCSIPAVGLVPPSTGGGGTGGVVSILDASTGDVITTVSCGGSYSVTQLTVIADDPDLNTTTIIDPL